MDPKQGLKAAAKSLPKRSTADEPERASEEASKTQVRQTLYLPTEVHDQIRDAAHVKRISQQEIFRRSLDMWFASEGLASWAELTSEGR